MKQFKTQTSSIKPNGSHPSAKRKPSLGSFIGKENTNSANINLLHTDRKSLTKDGSPKNSTARGIQSGVFGNLAKQKQYKFENSKLKKSSGSQEKKPSVEKIERSFTPGTIKELMSKARMNSFHYSPKENFKVNFQGKYMRSNSPKNHRPSDLFKDMSKVTSKTLNGSSSKTRQLDKKPIKYKREQSTEGLVPCDGFQSQTDDLHRHSGDARLPDQGTDKGLVAYTPRCVNHPTKKSRFYLTELSTAGLAESESGCRSGVCSKCAVKLATSGHNIEEIDCGEEHVRNKKIAGLLQRIRTVLELVKLTEEHIDLRESQVNCFYQPDLEALESAELHIHRLFSTFLENIEKVRKLIMVEHREKMIQCQAFKQKLELKASELQNLTHYLNQYQHKDASCSELLSLDSNMDTFNHALATTVEDCKALRDMKLSGIKLRAGMTTPAQQIEAKLFEITKVRQTDILYQDPQLDKFTHQMALWLEINRQFSGPLAAESSMDSVSWNEDHCKKSAFISFEKTEEIDTVMVDSEAEAWTCQAQSPSKHYQSILERIDESQIQKNKFYSSVLVTEKDPLFLVNVDSREFSEKQTPELGLKDQVPGYLKEQFTKLHQQYEQVSMHKKTGVVKASEDECQPHNISDKVKQSASSNQTTCAESKDRFAFTSSFLQSQSDKTASLSKR